MEEPSTYERAVPLLHLEVAYGLAVGRYDIPELPPLSGVHPRAALEGVLLEALRRPPCLVSFSGGVDSSALLAVATSVARRHGLPDPVPATLVFRESAESDEREWQYLVLDHLELRRADWLRFDFSDELDAVGPVAQEVLLRHGLVWPFNLHFHLPIVKAAAGGSVVTGFGGDELGRSSAGLFAERLFAKRRFKRPQDLALIAYRLSPSGVNWARELLRSEDFEAELPWLTPYGRKRLRFALARESTHPFGWDALLREYVWPARYFQVCRETFRIMAAPYDVRMFHPFVEPPVLRTLGRGRVSGLGGRRGIYEFLFGGLLPPALLERTTKAVFDDPLWTSTASAFARSWSGRGLDERLVDPAALRAHWLNPERSVMATTALQAAWLVDNAPS